MFLNCTQEVWGEKGDRLMDKITWVNLQEKEFYISFDYMQTICILKPIKAFAYIVYDACACMSQGLTFSLYWCIPAWDWPYAPTTMFPWKTNFKTIGKH